MCQYVSGGYRIQNRRFTDVCRTDDFTNAPSAEILRAEDIILHRTILDIRKRPCIGTGMSDHAADRGTDELGALHRAFVKRNISLDRTVVHVIIARGPADHAADSGIFRFSRRAADKRAVQKVTVAKRDLLHTVHTFHKRTGTKRIFADHIGSKNGDVFD